MYFMQSCLMISNIMNNKSKNVFQKQNNFFYSIEFSNKNSFKNKQKYM